ncbi:hypothetical protein L7F22_054312 [Adiantum nelumboides]|nr:hypothetical protein [Adiantum nelumboides]
MGKFFVIVSFEIVCVEGKKNVIADALSRKPQVSTITTFGHRELDDMREQYAIDLDFDSVIEKMQDVEAVSGYNLKDGFLMKRNKLCFTGVIEGDYNVFKRGIVGLVATVFITTGMLYPCDLVGDYRRSDYSSDFGIQDTIQIRFRAPDSASHCQKWVIQFLQKTLKLPDLFLILLFSVSLRGWIVLFGWFALAPVAYRWELGPLYILATAFAVIFFNLGKRQEGDISAYSIFNEGFRELPGTLNAERLDRDIRAGYEASASEESQRALCAM